MASRAQCQHCRFQKCLKIGMDPELVQPMTKKSESVEQADQHKVQNRGATHCIETMFEAKELINNALHFLNWPNAKSRPFLNVSTLVTNNSSLSPLAFTQAEVNFIRNMSQIKMEACQSIVYPTAMFDVFLDMAVAPKPQMVSEWMPIGVKCHLEKMIKFANNLDFFQA